jgi:uncharacterized membrane protein
LWSISISIPYVQAQVPFTIVVSPDGIVLGTRSGFTDRFGVTVIAGQGFNGTVSLSVFGVPPGVTAVFQDWGAYLTPLALFTTYLEVTSSTNATPGHHIITISATSQHGSSFYIASTRVSLVIQDDGQPRPLLEGSATQVATPSASGQEYVISLTVLGLAAGIALGSVTTYVFIRERKRPARKANAE